MKEDILEQIIDDWFLSEEGTFTKNNIKFKPDQTHTEFDKLTDSNTSDIDILAVSLNKIGKERVRAVTCKSWQGGFDVKDWLKCLTTNEGKNQKGGRDAWKYFREITKPKWAKAFVDKIYHETGERSFTYIIAVTAFKRNVETESFIRHELFHKMLTEGGAEDFEIKFITANEIINSYFGVDRPSHTLASSQLGRLMQIMRASGIAILNE